MRYVKSYMYRMIEIGSVKNEGHLYDTIRFIHQGTVVNNLGPDRLTGPKALDPNHAVPENQSFDCTTFVWKS